MYSNREQPDNIERGAIRFEESGNREGKKRIVITTRPNENDKTGEITLDHQQSIVFKGFLHSWLTQITHVFHNPPNKTHLKIHGGTICHHNAEAPNYPSGILTAQTEATFNGPIGDQQEVQLNPTQALVPIPAYDGPVPQLDWCEHCLSKAEGLGILQAQDTEALPPGNPHPPCPECGKRLQIYENAMGLLQIRHTDNNSDCPLTGSGMNIDIKRQAEEAQIIEVIEEILGIDTLTGIPAPVKPDHQLQPPEELPADLEINLNHDPNIHIQYYLLCDADNAYDPETLIELDHPAFESKVALRFSEVVDILDSDVPIADVVPSTTQPNKKEEIQTEDNNGGSESQPSKIPDSQTLPGFSNLINQIKHPDQEESNHGCGVEPYPEISETELERSLAPLPTTSAISNGGMYSPEEVSKRVEEYTTEDNTVNPDKIDVKRTSAFTFSSLGTSDPKSRHYHQRILNPQKGVIEKAFTALDLPSEGHCTIFGGYTGEFARAIGEYGYTISFTDPIEAWVDRARSYPSVDRARQLKYSDIPANEFKQADLIASFECYHPVEASLGRTLYNLLRATYAPNGLVFATSKETIQQMENQHGSIQQFRSRWQSITDIYQDLTLRYTDKENIRFWHLSPGDPSPDNTGHIERTIDRLTILELVKLAAAKQKGVTIDSIDEPNAKIMELAKGLEEQIDLTDANVGELFEAHPVCQHGDDTLYRSLGRIGKIYQSENNVGSVLPNDVIHINGIAYRLPKQALKLI